MHAAKGSGSRLIAVLALSLLAAGCFHSKPQLSRPDYLAALKKVRTVGLVRPYVKVYELDAGGVRGVEALVSGAE